jgi:hypothetical protein
MDGGWKTGWVGGWVEDWLGGWVSGWLGVWVRVKSRIPPTDPSHLSKSTTQQLADSPHAPASDRCPIDAHSLLPRLQQHATTGTGTNDVLVADSSRGTLTLLPNKGPGSSPPFSSPRVIYRGALLSMDAIEVADMNAGDWTSRALVAGLCGPPPPPLFTCCSPDDDRVWYFEGNGAKPPCVSSLYRLHGAPPGWRACCGG